MKRALCVGSLALASGKVYFSETFGTGWEGRWKTSTWKESEGTQGKWAPATGKWFTDAAEDTGIQTAEDSKFFGISASFDSFSNAGTGLIFQYQVKYEKDVECGGSYMKIGPKMPDPAAFGDPTVYNIMFGPDKCGYTQRTHLIFNYKGKNVLKTTDLDYKQVGEGTSHLYRLVLRPDNTVLVEIDEEKIYEGLIQDDWEVLKPKEIPDPADKKPDDWTDESMIDDPEDKKPDDWVEEKRIIESESKQPHDWDDEEDGEWEAPMKDNPAYKGDWYGKKISNPAYKGVWEVKQIPNPEYEADDSIYKFDDFGFIGFDLWQVKGGTIFDNVIITDSKAEADTFAKKWKTLSEFEKSKKKEEDDAKTAESKADEKAEEMEEDDDDDAKTDEKAEEMEEDDDDDDDGEEYSKESEEM